MHQDVLAEALRNPRVKKEYGKLGPEFERRREKIRKRMARVRTRKYGVCTGAVAVAVFVGRIGEGKNRMIFMVNRMTRPYGWALPAAHVIDPLEDWPVEKRDAAKRDAVAAGAGLREYEFLVEMQLSKGLTSKIGLKLCGFENFHEMVLKTECRRTGERKRKLHRWFIFEDCGTKGWDLVLNPDEVKEVRWVRVSELPKMNLAPVWGFILRELGYI